jgi:hypothetical protein
MLPRNLSKLVLTAHIVTSIGWLGAVLGYLALDVVATVGIDVAAVRAAFFGMDVTIRYVIVPLAITSVFIGVANALTTPWGLLRHYWVLVKLLLTLFAMTVLLLEVQKVSDMAQLASANADPRDIPGSLPHSAGGLVVLLVIAFLSVYKPKGFTRYGWRQVTRSRGNA